MDGENMIPLWSRQWFIAINAILGWWGYRWGKTWKSLFFY